jgi:MFS family permease
MIPSATRANAFAAFRHPNYRYFVMARVCNITASEMQSVAVAWQVYNLTHQPLDLGLVGLAQFLPGILLFLIAGHAADKHSRINILRVCCGLFMLSSLMLLYLAWHGIPSVYWIYAVLLLNGTVRAFNWPAGQALLPELIPKEDFANAVTWNSSSFQAAAILGPVLGGILYAATGDPVKVYACCAFTYTFGLYAQMRMKPRKRERPETGVAEKALDGFRYVFANRLVLGCISLDLFAVLLGGAVALLPVYARDILRVDAFGLGVLRSAPGAGAVLMALVLAYKPLRSKAGAIMLLCVAGFGVFTIIFGISKSVPLSVVCLALVGAADMVSVVVRNVVTQVTVPDSMRGRVSAVNMIFIGASNEVGEFESGLTAHWFGTVEAVVLGGVGTILIVILWTFLFPDLRKVDRLPEK